MRYLLTAILLMVPLCAQTPPAAPPAEGAPAAPPRRPRPQLPPPKNLKVLKLATTTEVQAYMTNVIAPSLGVQCQHCHTLTTTTSDYSLDDNPNKDISRKMFEMVDTINATVKSAQANSTVVVSCYTCHRGMAKPAFDVTAPAGSAAHDGEKFVDPPIGPPK